MGTSSAFFLILLFMLATVLIAYEMGRSADPYGCPDCSHCRDRRRERERRLREADADNERFRTALRRLAMPRPDDRVRVAAPDGGHTTLPQPGPRGGALGKILVGYDGGEAAKRALDLAVGLAEGLGASLAVVSVVPLHPGRMPIDPCDDREVHAQELLEAQEVAARRGVEVDLVEPVGEPARAIERAAEVGGFDAVLVGSPRSSGWFRALRGDVSAHLVSHSAKTVIIVH
jgi:nucleotide-binding universal stress UspA family protein